MKSQFFVLPSNVKVNKGIVESTYFNTCKSMNKTMLNRSKLFFFICKHIRVTKSTTFPPTPPPPPKKRRKKKKEQKKEKKTNI